MPYNVLSKPIAVVALDIGHGIDTFPPDKGVYRDGKGYAEHNFNSKLAIEIEKHLKQNGFKVIKIQQPFSKDVPLKTRTDFYNEQGVDIVWSLHANAGTEGAKGVCAFYWHDHGPSKRAAELFIEELRKEGFDTHGNGLHASMTGSWTNLHICRETKMTGVLTENGFMTNAKDFENIFGENQANYIQRLAVVHARAICRYFKSTYKEGSFTISNSEVEEEHEMIFHPSNQQLRDSVKIVLTRLSNKEPNGISKQWRKDFEEGKMTVSDGLAIQFYALDKELIQGSMKQKE
jgi:N-acetylmuramoyl-L-alanine amidase